MRHTTWVGVVLAVAGLGLWAGIARAQRSESVPTLGDRVRVTWCVEAGERCATRRRAEGRLLGRDSSGLRLAANDGSLHVPWPSIRHVEGYRGSRGALRTVLFGVGGLVLGGLTGAVIGTVVQGDCYEIGCLAGPVYGLLIGAPVGLLAGVSVAVGTRERWITTYRAPARPRRPAARAREEPRVAVGIAIPVGW